MNKALFEGVFIKHPTDCIYKIVIFLQLWRPLCRRKDEPMLERLISLFCAQASSLREAALMDE